MPVFQRHTLFASCCAAAVLGASPSIAQEATTPEESAGPAFAEGEILVTARRRDESLSRVPVTVDVVDAQTIKDAQISSELDLRTTTPGLQVRATLNSNQLNFAIRGASQDGFSGTRPGVLPYVNEVQINGNAGGSAFYDLENIQVLMGPQGTLFGRSATGGAVLYQTAAPTSEFAGYASALVGNYKARKVEGAISGPIAGDMLQARVAGVYSERDGFQENVIFGGREGDYERWGVRGSLRFAPTARLTNDLMVDYFESDSESTVGVISGLLPLGAPGQPPFVPAQLIYGGITDPVARATGIAVIQGALAAQGAVLPTAAVAAAYDAYFNNPQRPDGGIAQFLADQQARGPFKVGTDSENVYTTKNIILTNTTQYEISDTLTLKNIFGYVDVDNFTAFDTDGTPYVAGSQQARTISPRRGGNAIQTDAISNEIQLQGELGGASNFVTGLYYSKEDAEYLYDTDFFDLLVAPLGLASQRVFNAFNITNETIAPFAQATVALNDSGLSATGGLRYTREKVRKVRRPNDSGFGIADDDRSRTFEHLSWTGGLQWQANPETLLYVTSRRAYKSGGYNGSVALNGPAGIGGDLYEKEQVTDVEGGMKFNGLIGGRRVRASIAGYHNWLVDSQRTAFTLIGGAPAAVTVNVPKGTIYGVEAETSISLSDFLTVGGNANLMESKFSDGRVVINGVPLVYDRLPDAPNYAFAAFADLRVPVAGTLNAVFHADVYGQGEVYTSARTANNAGTEIGKYELVNMRAGVASDSGWSLIANVKNLFDKVHYVGGGSAGEIYQVNTLVPGEPRTFAVEARMTF